ncbi:hypothetical protein QTG54_011480 [Skeletonema marinoi]|uniref:Uncharacterized protein n=1 Tax=Skeletonema marinoi TaxID=267567 RepID=A0AAD8Y1E3_9STRA|nr:hypothetical protein QTG54_011480 [Skeletonema marinoi]
MTRNLFVLFLATITTTSAFAPSSSPHASRSSELHQTLLHDVEAGKATSWAGARYGDNFLSTGHYSPSETHGTRSTNAMDDTPSSPTSLPPRSHHYTRSSTHARSDKVIHTSTWVSSAHAEAGNDMFEWSGARRGDYGVIFRRAAPTASPWLE